jgi:hypothetical protein
MISSFVIVFSQKRQQASVLKSSPPFLDLQFLVNGGLRAMYVEAKCILPVTPILPSKRLRDD